MAAESPTTSVALTEANPPPALPPPPMAPATLGPIQALLVIAGSSFQVMVLAWRLSIWRRPMREVLARQIYFTGITALPITLLAAMAVGLSAVSQLGLWLNRLDMGDQFGELTATVLMQNLAPMLVNFIVIGRSGTAICTELGNMVVHDEPRVLQAQGIDLFEYLIIPRVVGMSVAVLGLTVSFVAVSLVGGFAVSMFLDLSRQGVDAYLSSILASFRPLDMLTFLAKTLVPASVSGVICCLHGLSIPPVITAVPQAATQSAVRAVGALFVISAVLTALGLI